MKRSIISLAVIAAIAVPAHRANAKIFELWAGGLVGGATGNGSNNNFFDAVGGAATGVEVGLSLLFLGVILDYKYFPTGDIDAHLFTANLGGDGSASLTDNLSFVYRLAGGFYAGDLVDAPPAAAAIHTRGVGARAGLGLDYALIGPLSVGIIPQIGYHVFFDGGGAGAEVSHGWDFQALARLKVGMGF